VSDSTAYNPIIAALDVPSPEEALQLVERLHEHVGAFKVGKELFTIAGPEIVRSIRKTGASVFLDLKFHDIPNTVAKAVAAAVRLDVQMLTIHTSGSAAMMKAAEASAVETAASLDREPPLVLGVTVLTSMDANELSLVGVEASPAQQVERLASLARDSGLRGLVCSPLELPLLRSFLPTEMKLVTPGIRPAGSAADDQKRTLSPREAIESGASWIVVGRPIYKADDPAAAAAEILASIRG